MQTESVERAIRGRVAEFFPPTDPFHWCMLDKNLELNCRIRFIQWNGKALPDESTKINQMNEMTWQIGRPVWLVHQVGLCFWDIRRNGNSADTCKQSFYLRSQSVPFGRVAEMLVQ